MVDYDIHEYRVNGRPLLDTVDPEALHLTPQENEHLQASKESYTSLFQPVEAQPDQCQLRVRDMLLPDFPEIISGFFDAKCAFNFINTASKYEYRYKNKDYLIGAFEMNSHFTLSCFYSA